MSHCTVLMSSREKGVDTVVYKLQLLNNNNRCFQSELNGTQYMYRLTNKNNRSVRHTEANCVMLGVEKLWRRIVSICSRKKINVWTILLQTFGHLNNLSCTVPAPIQCNHRNTFKDIHLYSLTKRLPKVQHCSPDTEMVCQSGETQKGRSQSSAIFFTAFKSSGFSLVWKPRLKFIIWLKLLEIQHAVLCWIQHFLMIETRLKTKSDLVENTTIRDFVVFTEALVAENIISRLFCMGERPSGSVGSASDSYSVGHWIEAHLV